LSGPKKTTTKKKTLGPLGVQIGNVITNLRALVHNLIGRLL